MKLYARIILVPLVFLLGVAWACPCTADEVVAVFNFAQRDDDPKYAWLSKGLADLLINQLSDLPKITVVSRDRMQSVSAEYQRMAAKPDFDHRQDAKPVAVVLKAERIVFGTYAVRDGQATVTVQITRIADESILFQTKATGPYGQVLDLERGLARQLRAHFLGRPVEAVPLKDVPQWTTSVGAAEHLYTGVDLFDRGEFAEAWLRFRKAGGVDTSFADAIYWQGRMLYYLMLYENARPLLERFFMTWPLHPRAGDAAIELLDSYRQSQSDPQVLRDIYQRLRQKVDPRTVVHNKSTPGRETETLLRTYLGGFVVQAERALGHYGPAADLAIELQDEAYRAFGRSGVDKRHWGFYDQLACFTAMERRTFLGQIRLNKAMLSGDWYGLEVTQVKPEWTWRRVNNVRWRPFMVGKRGRYRVTGCGHREWWFIAPEGHVFSDVSVEADSHHESGTTPFLIFIRWGQWTDGESSLLLGSTEDGHAKATLDIPDNCRILCIRVSTQADHFGGTGGTDYYIDTPYRDYVKRFQVTYALRPVRQDTGRIRVRLENVEKARVYLDGKVALLVDGMIHGVTPGEHTLRAWASKGKTYDRSNVFLPVAQKITVQTGQTAECRLKFPFRPLRATTGWQSPRVVSEAYPLATLPPKTGDEEMTQPCLLRATRGPLAGHLVALWSYREELWLSYSQDDGTSWTPAERLPIPVNSAHVEMAPQLIQDEAGRFCLTFVSDRNIERAFYPYVATSSDLRQWTAPRKAVDVVCDSLVLLQNQAGRYVPLVPPPFRGGEWGMPLRHLGGMTHPEVRVDVVSAYGKKYARKRFKIFTSSDLAERTELATQLGNDKVREVDLLQKADGTYHAVYTSLEKQRAMGDSLWRVCHQTSRDLVTWTPVEELLSASWEYRNPVIATDGKQVFGSIVVSGNNVHRFNIGGPDQTSWWGFASTRNVMYHDPPSYGNRLHWLWLCFEGNPQRYQPNAGKVYYSWRPSDRGEWLFEMPKHLPPAPPEEVRQKQRLLTLANARAVPPGRPQGDLKEFRHEKFPYSVQIPADWTPLSGPRTRRMGFLAPVRYGVLQPYFDVFVWDAGSIDEIEKLGSMAARRWAGGKGEHWTLEYADHPSGSRAYMLVYEYPWTLKQPIVTKTYGILHNGKEYRLNARCPVEAAEEWMPVLNRMLDSFRFTSKQHR